MLFNRILSQLTDFDLNAKRVLIREDFNVPMANGCILSEARLQAALPTLRHALALQAGVILLSHLGRPVEGGFSPAFSLAPVARRLQTQLGQPVRLVRDWLAGVAVQPGEVVLCENVRMQRGERANDPALARQIAQLGDIFVMDAFAAAHRREASTIGVTQFAKHACAGPLLCSEVNHLYRLLLDPAPPKVAVVGGAKISTKLRLLESLLAQGYTLLPGGGLANTFLAAKNQPIGASLYEPECMLEAARLLRLADDRRDQGQLGSIVLPEDVVVARDLADTEAVQTKTLSEITSQDRIFDLGPASTRRYAAHLQSAGTIVWNGPVGVFEQAPFRSGTAAIAQAIATSQGISIAGGGDTLSAIEHFHIAEHLSYCSTGGGAFLSFLEGLKATPPTPLPAIEALLARDSAAVLHSPSTVV